MADKIHQLSSSANEVCHPSEVSHLDFMTILKSFYCRVTTYSGGGPVHARVPIHAHPQFS